MGLKRCPACGASYISVVARCADCDVVLVADEPGGAAPGDAADTGSEAPSVAAPAANHPAHRHEDDDDVEFDLTDWSPDERAVLGERLTEAGIAHRWHDPAGGPEAGWLVVADVDADQVDDILDEVEFPDALEAVDDDGASDEASYAVMSDLYVAADKLKKNPDDPIAGDDMVNAAAVAATAAIPFGVEIRVWEQVQSLATELSRLLDEDGDASTVAANAATLRDILSRFV